MGGWPRGHRRSADIKEIGFSGPFFTRRHEITTRRQEMERRRQPASAAGNPAGCHPAQPIPPAAAAIRPDPGAVARTARRALAAGRMRAPGTRTPVPGCRAGRRSASGQPPARVAGAAPGFTCSPGRPAGNPGRPGTCWPPDSLCAVPRRCPPASRDAGQGGQPAAPRPPRGGRAGALPPVTVAIPVPRGPAYRQAVSAGLHRSPGTSGTCH